MAGEPRTEAGRDLVALVGMVNDRPDPAVVDYILAIEDEAAGWPYRSSRNPYVDMRAAITAAIADIRERHVKVGVTEMEMRDWENYNYRFTDRPRPECFTCQERWPCPDALLADRLTAALGEGRGTEGEVAKK